MKKWLTLLLLILNTSGLYSQVLSSNANLGDESILYATTKQVNQFFRRFNAEETTKGDRLYEGDDQYRNQTLRAKYLNILFDLQNATLSEPLKNDFRKSLLDNQAYLSFHKDGWFAEVTTKFLYQGKDEYITLFMKIEEENEGYKWVITNVYFPHFSNLLATSSTGNSFLHPMSHEIDFMNLVRVFNQPKSVEQYVVKDYKPDYLSLFLYELKKDNLKYRSVTNLKFHFFQIPGWYFEVSQFNRPGTNSGWLISNLMKVNEGEREILLKYILHE